MIAGVLPENTDFLTRNLATFTYLRLAMTTWQLLSRSQCLNYFLNLPTMSGYKTSNMCYY